MARFNKSAAKNRAVIAERVAEVMGPYHEVDLRNESLLDEGEHETFIMDQCFENFDDKKGELRWGLRCGFDIPLNDGTVVQGFSIFNVYESWDAFIDVVNFTVPDLLAGDDDEVEIKPMHLMGRRIKVRLAWDKEGKYLNVARYMPSSYGCPSSVFDETAGAGAGERKRAPQATEPDLF